jgi:hypothetical protein
MAICTDLYDSEPNPLLLYVLPPNFRSGWDLYDIISRFSSAFY